MRNLSQRVTRTDGFTLIEVLIAMAVLLIGVLGTLTIIDRANARTVSTRSHEAAVNMARELLEGARSVPFANLTPATIEGQMQALPGLADDGAPAGWTIRRRGVTFTVDASVCTFDDARDELGSHSAGNFCSDSGAGTLDKNPEDYRRVTVTVSWTDRGVDRQVHESLLVNNPGSAGAPAARTLDIDDADAAKSSTTNQVTSDADNKLRFTLTTSSRPTTLHWLLDGTSQEPITSGSGLSWNFEWSLGPADIDGSVVDGTYVVSAEAFDSYGVAGPSRSLTVSLNRTPPDKVTGVAGGRTGDPAQPQNQVVDLEWLPSRERDIVGYSVERVDAANNVVEVCARKDQTTCIDGNPPVQDGLKYYVYAWDTDPVSGQPRKGPYASDALVVRLGNNPPNPPTAVTAAVQADGSVQLNWLRPVPDDPDAGDKVAFYRIYRDGTAYDARYAAWIDSGLTVQFIDGNTGGTAHEYWVTAVDTNYAESPAVKAVYP
jgi:prepilin-type N-terminal cleavage/methylation domain-containing protein